MFAQPESAYVHIPFCEHRCGYCNFTLIAGRNDLMTPFVEALGRELELQVGTRCRLKTLYLGGGTPTYLSYDRWNDLIDHLRRWFDWSDDCEFTVEANPADITPELVDRLLSFGVNRISLGLQSFDDAKLQNLDRNHSSKQAMDALNLLTAHFERVSLDLIFAAPEESMETWQNDLQTALASNVSHISTYGLTFEEGTAFHSSRSRGTIISANEELERSMYLESIETLTKHGFEHYEISNFAQPAHRSCHNQIYWRGKSYFGLGPGAASFLNGRRSTNQLSVTRYLNCLQNGQSPVMETEALGELDLAKERFIFGLRMLEGVRLDDRQIFGDFTVEEVAHPALPKFIDLGLLESIDATIRMTREGLLVSDSMWPEFLDS